MAQITSILCQIITGKVSGASTDGNVYMGLGGREFRLDSSEDDYQSGSWREYILGGAPFGSNLPAPQIRVHNKDQNDPRKGFPLDTNDLNRTPVYIRFEPEGPSDNWNVRFAAVLVFATTFVIGYTPPEVFDNLFLGQAMGKILYLTSEHKVEQVALDIGRKVAAQNVK